MILLRPFAFLVLASTMYAAVAAEPASAPVPASEAAGRMTVPKGFRVTLCAAEPDVRQPIAFTIDPKGRLWVAECFSYPAWKQKQTEPDRIVILEDADGDGRFESHKVFWDKSMGTTVSGVALGFGGVWVCATPNLLFIPDRDGDDVPDGEAVVVLDGWDVKAGHNLFNALNWGPDGWLYGCNGIQSNSRVGNPGTPDDRRVPINCGVWRYHPTRNVFEAVAHGTTNPWGLDFDDHGEAFITNCVIPHLFHVVPGAHFERMYGLDFDSHAYSLIGSCADHIHWAGGSWQDSREGVGKHGEAGGGHAHAGAMVYLGDNWPDRYRDSVFMSNLHGHRINQDKLTRKGAGYVARHEPDFLFANDPWFRGLELKSGPDGAVYLTDWSDTGECHETDADGSHRENGRIYKVAYGTPARVSVDLARLDDEALARLQTHKNEWHVRTARRLLQERAAAGQDMQQAHRLLRDQLRAEGGAPRRLRALWALYATAGLDDEALTALLADKDESVRGWAVRLLVDRGAPDPKALARFADLARDDPSPRVRLALASALQRIPEAQRWAVAEGLVGHAEDARDAELPLMIWFGIDALVPTDPARAAALAERSRIPRVGQYLARRLVAGDPASGLAALLPALGRARDDETRRDLLDGALDALRGRKHVARPDDWNRVAAPLLASRDPGVRARTTRLALDLGDPDALASLRATMLNEKATRAERVEALSALVERRVPELAPSLLALMDGRDLRREALRALAAYDDPAIPARVLALYPTLDADARADAISTLAARPTWALALLDAIGAGTIPRRELSVAVARQLQGFNDRKIGAKLGEVWGQVRPAAREKAASLPKWKALLTPERLQAADPARGRSIFDRTCSQCHRLFDAGNAIGPDLTGSDRANLDYVLENVLDPSAAVAKEYTVTSIATTDGRLIAGIVVQQTEAALTVQTVNERVVVPRDEIEALKPSSVSMMPEGQLDTLKDDEVADLAAYLRAKAQVEPPRAATRP